MLQAAANKISDYFHGRLPAPIAAALGDIHYVAGGLESQFERALAAAEREDS